MNLTNDVIIHEKKGDIEYIQFRKLLEYKNIKHAYMLKPLDFRTHNENNIVSNYDKICKELNIDVNNIVRPMQEHTNNVEIIEQKINKLSPDINMEYLKAVDGLLTSNKNIILATTNADCILIMFYDPVKNIIANIHSGWRGTFKKISSKTIEKMKKEYGCNPADILVFICPSIRMCHFEVEDDVENECKEIFSYTNRIADIIKKGEVKEDKQKYYVDTVLITKILLEENGIKSENIFDSNICSVCNKELVHSRRGDGTDYGLCSAIITII